MAQPKTKPARQISRLVPGAVQMPIDNSAMSQAQENARANVPMGPLARLVAGVRFALTGNINQAWFGPGQPLTPMAPAETKGRQLDYSTGQNLRITPRGDEAISFRDLRGLADNADLVRLAIETRKDQMEKLQWSITNADADIDSSKDPRVLAITEFLRYPDRVNSWATWLRKLLEDLLVIDAPTIYPRLTNGGDLYSLDIIDGSTIKLLIDQDGRTPAAPDPAYQQILKGIPASDYSVDELIYLPRNPRSWKFFGMSPVEQIIMTINTVLRRNLHKLQFYTEGTVPDAIAGVPQDWSGDQIKEFQDNFDGMLTGNTADRRKIKFVPGGFDLVMTKEAALKDEADEWFARVICYCFSLPPTAFIKQQNRATAGTQQDTAASEGLQPLMCWVAEVINRVVAKYFGFSDLRFTWNTEDDTDPNVSDQIIDRKLRSGRLTLNEARQLDGLPAVKDGDVPLIYIATGAVTLESVVNPPDPPAPGVVDENGMPIAPTDPRHPSQKAIGVDPKGNAAADASAGDGGDGGDEEKPDPVAKLAKRKPVRALNMKHERASVIMERSKLSAALKAVFELAVDTVAAQLSHLTKSTDDDDRNSIDFGIFGEVADEVYQALLTVANEASDQGLEDVGVSNPEITKLANTRAEEWAKQRAAELIGKDADGGELANATRTLIRSTVTEAIEQGYSNAQLKKELSETYAFSQERADVIARTEMKFADSEGALAGWKASGVVTGKVWQVSESDCCDICQDNEDAGEVGIDEEFPSGDDTAPAHPNCNCIVSPIVGDETADEE